jgi:wobble nucleotide-excising tRNase
MKRSEYQSLLKRAYDFASSEAETRRSRTSSRNVLRRIVEGYSTFNYGIKMEMLARDPALVEGWGQSQGTVRSCTVSR